MGLTYFSCLEYLNENINAIKGNSDLDIQILNPIKPIKDKLYITTNSHVSFFISIPLLNLVKSPYKEVIL